MKICDKRIQEAIQAFADEVYDGDWDKITVTEFRAIVMVCAIAKRKGGRKHCE